MKTSNRMANLPVAVGSVVLLAILGTAVTAAALDPVDLLIVDLTQTVEDSMRVEALARVLMMTSSVPFRISASFGLPEDTGKTGPVDLVLMLPETGRFIWLCAPALTAELPLPLQNAVQVVGTIANRVFDGDRLVVGLEDDLVPFFWSARFYRQGMFDKEIVK